MFAADVRRANEVVEELEVRQVKTCYVSRLQWTIRLRNHADNQRLGRRGQAAVQRVVARTSTTSHTTGWT